MMNTCEGVTVQSVGAGLLFIAGALLIYLGPGIVLIRASERADRSRLVGAWVVGIPVGVLALWVGFSLGNVTAIAIFGGLAGGALAGRGAAYALPEHGSWKAPFLGTLGTFAPIVFGFVWLVQVMSMTQFCFD